MENSIQSRLVFALAVLLAGLLPRAAAARVLGETSATGTFNLTAKADVISTSDGDSMWMWGYAVNGRRMQYPGPTLIVNQGDTVTVTLRNQLPVPVSMVFPGLSVRATGGAQGLLTREVPAAGPGVTTGPVTYVFTADQPGTYSYTSGTRRDLEVEMGLFGAIVVRPRLTVTRGPARAYQDASTAYEQEFLYEVSEADPLIHQQVAFGNLTPDMSKRRAVDWFINGRNFPDTLQDANATNLPTQPYNCAPRMHPADRVLIRWVGAGTDLHPFHTHGQNHVVIARDGRLLSSPGVAAPDLGVSDYTTTNVPGETADAIWGPWTGARLSWDVYGTADVNPHDCNPDVTQFDPTTHEYCPDHYRPIPVTLPSQSDLNYGIGGGGMWGGTPYLGVSGDVPPVNPGAQTQLNVTGGIAFMWHSHAERELTTNNIFIGGMASMALVVPVSVPIP
jgi:FtsP/CotA-like multicopper oxidase with cupredoxin domain